VIQRCCVASKGQHPDVKLYFIAGRTNQQGRGKGDTDWWRSDDDSHGVPDPYGDSFVLKLEFRLTRRMLAVLLEDFLQLRTFNIL
jgi:hypothetical protein